MIDNFILCKVDALKGPNIQADANFLWELVELKGINGNYLEAPSGRG